jgi:IS1 family transposase
VRYWCRKFGQTYANQLRHRRPRPGDKWHLDEVFLTINGQRHYLWRAVDQDGHILDILVQRRRDKQAAKRFFRKLLKGLTYVPRVIITDRLKSYGAALRESLPSVEHRQHWYLNNRSESVVWGDSSLQDIPNAFLPPMARSPRTSARGVTGSRLPCTVRRCSNASGSGGRLQSRPSPRKDQAQALSYLSAW